ncbi:MAG TPA: Nif3-like dinuclear metal center hexameric protein, partial [Acidobacteriota bacterium]|nr:Nif3-like dinuclear metal center hexameric protein [Acidobacteriota bacterium]
ELDRLLNLHAIEDESVNGLQVEGRAEVRRAGFAVDYSPELAVQAAADGIDFLFVHHGMIWGGLRHVRGVTLAYLKPLIEHGLSLYAAHLPLDVHPELGHNIQMARLLELRDPSPIIDYKGLPIGILAHTDGPVLREDLLAKIRATISCDVHFLPFGPEWMSHVAIVSGSGARLALEAREAGADFYLTGETSHSAYHQIKAAGLNVCFAGHYLTEKWGVLAVMRHLQERGLVVAKFYDIPTPF